MRKRLTLICVVTAFCSSAFAVREADADLITTLEIAGTAEARYDKYSGQVVVSVDNVLSWIVESLSGGMVGPDDAGDVLPLGGGLYAGNLLRVGETNFETPFSYTDVNLGRIAAPGLTDVTIRFNGPDGQSQVGIVGVVPEPSAFLLLGLVCTGYGSIGFVRKRLRGATEFCRESND